MAPIHVGRCGLISCRCVDLVAKDATRWRHTVSSSWTGVVKFTRSPFAVFKSCWRRVNIPTAPAMAGTVLRRVPSSLCQRRREHQLALGGVVSSRASKLVLRSARRVRTCFTVSITQPMTTYFVLQAVSPFRSFLKEMGSSHAMLSLLLVGFQTILSLIFENIDFSYL